MSPDHWALLLAVIASASGGGGVVAWFKYRGDQKIKDFQSTLDGFRYLLTSEREGREALEKRYSLQEKQIVTMQAQIVAIRDCKQNIERDNAVLVSKNLTGNGFIIRLLGILKTAGLKTPKPPALIEEDIRKMLGS